MMVQWTRVTGRRDPRSFRCFDRLAGDPLLRESITCFKEEEHARATSRLTSARHLKAGAVFTEGLSPLSFPSTFSSLPPAPPSRFLLYLSHCELGGCSVELMRQVLNICPRWWSLCFVHGRDHDMRLHQAERAAGMEAAASKCRFGGWAEVDGSIAGYLLQLRELRTIIVSLAPWYMLEFVPGADPAFVPGPSHVEYAGALASWTEAAIHAAVFS